MSVGKDGTWYIKRGSANDVLLTWYTDDAGTTAQDLTSASASLKIKKREGSTELLALTSGSGITLGGVAGTILVAPTATQTRALPKNSILKVQLEVTLSGATNPTLLWDAAAITNEEIAD